MFAVGPDKSRRWIGVVVLGLLQLAQSSGGCKPQYVLRSETPILTRHEVLVSAGHFLPAQIKKYLNRPLFASEPTT